MLENYMKEKKFDCDTQKLMRELPTGQAEIFMKTWEFAVLKENNSTYASNQIKRYKVECERKSNANWKVEDIAKYCKEKGLDNRIQQQLSLLPPQIQEQLMKETIFVDIEFPVKFMQRKITEARKA